jgi:ArsR family transcriptional regulator, arsenate/arsenite/antimonite-responsive transcriptional repressor
MQRLMARDEAEMYAAWFRALSDPTRVQLVAYLARQPDPVPVGDLTRALPVGQSTVSHHLAALAAVGFVEMQRAGNCCLYRVNPRCVECFPTAADVVMGHCPPDRLDSSSCTPRDPDYEVMS